eukprot:CAMPEP_0185157910 /NCGR_PEP_ID=MMETSP1139-20130426/2078_1 /TAXON_ID=298111 /ORGANISM="Pavlova sp., Strain CCMP459" /LENGTH=61 /DNA_ID=CAMNT_0027723015 /DNA_START=541 /DNA_END=726 /DNA_ORIENTATION=-
MATKCPRDAHVHDEEAVELLANGECRPHISTGLTGVQDKAIEHAAGENGEHARHEVSAHDS